MDQTGEVLTMVYISRYHLCPALGENTAFLFKQALEYPIPRGGQEPDVEL